MPYSRQHLVNSVGFIFLIVLIVPLSLSSAQPFYTHEEALRADVLSGYKHKIRPKSTVQCDVRFSLLEIDYLDLPNQLLSTTGWLFVKWTDSRLSWTPAKYGNITDFYETEQVLWRPELIVDNSVNLIDGFSNKKLLIQVTHMGELTWEPPAMFETHCEVDVTYYPFDTQTCHIEITSWGYTLNEVNLSAMDKHIYLVDFNEDGEWEVLDSWNERNVFVDGGTSHSRIDFSVQLRRRSMFYVLGVFIPIIVTSVLVVFVFLIPPKCSNKISYPLTIHLVYMFMLTLLTGYLSPSSKTTSILSIYITNIFFVEASAILLTVTSVYLYMHEDDTKPPSCLTKFLRWFFIPCIGWEFPDVERRGDKNADQVNKVHAQRAQSVVYPGETPLFDNRGEFSEFSKIKTGGLAKESNASRLANSVDFGKVYLDKKVSEECSKTTNGAVVKDVAKERREYELARQDRAVLIDAKGLVNSVEHDKVYLDKKVLEESSNITNGAVVQNVAKERREYDLAREDREVLIDAKGLVNSVEHDKVCLDKKVPEEYSNITNGAVVSDVAKERRDYELTWQDCSSIMDAFFFRFYGLLVFILTSAIMLTLLIGGHFA